MFNKKTRIAVLVSGRGSNMGAIQKAIELKKLDAEIALVLSDNKNAKALEYCADKGIPAKYIHPGLFKTKLEGEAEMDYIEAIQKANPDIVVLAGFMRVIKPRFILAFAGKIINIHPSLLPKYPGLHTHKRALEAGDKETGCTVHFVNEVIDGGKRIMQARVPIQPGDTENDIAARVLKQEHQVLPEVIRMIAAGEISERTCPPEPIQFKG
jgi:phosphoribosylglycinamide formyltransferase-1